MVIAKQTYCEQVVDYVKEQILRGELNPGEQIKEVAMAESLGISRAPIREALQLLVREGLVESRPQRGKFVVELTSKEILDSYFVGGVLEGAAVGATMHLYEERDIRELEEIIYIMKVEALDGGDHIRLNELDHRFHRVIFSKNGNRLLGDLWQRTSRGVTQFLLFRHWVNVFTPEEHYDRHFQIIERIKKGDAVELEFYMREHYMDAGRRMARFGCDVYPTEEK